MAGQKLRQIPAPSKIKLHAQSTPTVPFGAEPLENVIQAIGPERRELVVPVALERNVRNVGGLNAGIKMLVEFLGLTDNSLVGLVQSSVILQPGWLKSLEANLDNNQLDVAFGRLVDEETPSRIWADGHYLEEGRTLNLNHKENLNYEECTDSKKLKVPDKKTFACLSAALFRGEVVRKIIRRYGNFVFSELEHYGDCTDVALRAKAAANAKFGFCKDAVATKRWPTLDRRRSVLTSQVVAAALYYEKKRKAEATERLKRKAGDSKYFVDAINFAENILRLKYSVCGKEPPPSAVPLESGSWM